MFQYSLDVNFNPLRPASAGAAVNQARTTTGATPRSAAGLDTQGGALSPLYMAAQKGRVYCLTRLLRAGAYSANEFLNCKLSTDKSNLRKSQSAA